MAKKKLFGNNIKPACKYCEHSSKLSESDETEGESIKLNCAKFGEVKPYDSCKKFVYSPLKRIPTKEIGLAHSDVSKIEF